MEISDFAFGILIFIERLKEKHSAQVFQKEEPLYLPQSANNQIFHKWISKEILMYVGGLQAASCLSMCCKKCNEDHLYFFIGKKTQKQIICGFVCLKN